MFSAGHFLLANVFFSDVVPVAKLDMKSFMRAPKVKNFADRLVR